MKNTKLQFCCCAYYDYSGLQTFFETQLRKGWMLKGTTPYGYSFRRTTPQEGHFAVTYIPQDKVENTDQIGQLQELCSHDGWELVVTNGQMLIFFNPQEDPIPIQTDPLVQIENIHKCLKAHIKSQLRILVALPAVILFCMLLGTSSLLMLENDAFVAAIITGVLNVPYSIIYAVVYYRWYTKARKTYETDGTMLPTKSPPAILKYTVFLYPFLLMVTLLCGSFEGLGLLLMCAWPFVEFVLQSHRERRNKESRWNFNARSKYWVSIAVICLLVIVLLIPMLMIKNAWYKANADRYLQKMPLRLEHLESVESVERTQDAFYWNIDESFLLPRYELSDEAQYLDGSFKELSYTITKVRLPVLYETCKKSILKEQMEPYIQVDGTPWNADTVYYCHPDTWILCYEDSIVELTLSFEPTDDQKTVVGEKLKKN